MDYCPSKGCGSMLVMGSVGSRVEVAASLLERTTSEMLKQNRLMWKPEQLQFQPLVTPLLLCSNTPLILFGSQMVPTKNSQYSTL